MENRIIQVEAADRELWNEGPRVRQYNERNQNDWDGILWEFHVGRRVRFYNRTRQAADETQKLGLVLMGQELRHSESGE